MGLWVVTELKIGYYVNRSSDLLDIDLFNNGLDLLDLIGFIASFFPVSLY